MKIFGILIASILLLTIPVSCEVWKWKECKKVGHGTAYCLYNIGHKK